MVLVFPLPSLISSLLIFPVLPIFVLKTQCWPPQIRICISHFLGTQQVLSWQVLLKWWLSINFNIFLKAAELWQRYVKGKGLQWEWLRKLFSVLFSKSVHSFSQFSYIFRIGWYFMAIEVFVYITILKYFNCKTLAILSSDSNNSKLMV